MEDARDTGSRRIAIGILLAMGAGMGIDLILDAPETVWSFHVLYELALGLASLGLAVRLWRQLGEERAANARLVRSLAERSAERDLWRAHAERALDGFGRAVAEQFDRWELTGAEREVALQLLKGKSHKEIAAATDRSERTVRQHAVAVYEKAGLDGRAALAAFFLDALALPPAGATAPVPPSAEAPAGR